MDVISFVIDAILNITKPIRIIATFIADLTYRFIRKAGSA